MVSKTFSFLAGVGLPRSYGINWGIFGVTRGDSIWLKPASETCPGRDSNPHEGNPHRILSPVRPPQISRASLTVYIESSKRIGFILANILNLDSTTFRPLGRITPLPETDPLPKVQVWCKVVHIDV